MRLFSSRKTYSLLLPVSVLGMIFRNVDVLHGPKLVTDLRINRLAICLL